MDSVQLLYASALKAKHCCHVGLWNSQVTIKEELYEFELHEALTRVNTMV